MADHEHGEMEVSSHERTFNGFIIWVRNVSIFSIAVLIFLAVFNS